MRVGAGRRGATAADAPPGDLVLLKLVTLSGCVRSQRERRALAAFVTAQPGVERVLDELSIGVPRRAAVSPDGIAPPLTGLVRRGRRVQLRT